jgi:hypothetical protein
MFYHQQQGVAGTDGTMLPSFMARKNAWNGGD